MLQVLTSLFAKKFVIPAKDGIGRRALFACQPQAAKVVAETAVLAYELERRGLARMLDEHPDETPVALIEKVGVPA